MVKFGLSLIQVGRGLPDPAGRRFSFADGAFRMPLMFLIVMYMLHTSGEMFMSPVGLSQMTKLSPLSIVSFVMAVWYMALSMANLVGGLHRWASPSTETIGGQVLDPAAALAQSLLVFKISRPDLDRHWRAVPGPVADPQEVVARLGRHQPRAGREPASVAP